MTKMNQTAKKEVVSMWCALQKKYFMSSISLIVLLFLTLTGIAQGVRQDQKPGNEPTPQQRMEIEACYGQLPLSFIPNQGQVDEQVTFYAKTPGYSLWFTSGGLVFDRLIPETQDKGKPETATRERSTKPKKSQREVSRLEFVGGNADPMISGSKEQEQRVSYFRGNDPAKWRTGISSFAEVYYQGIYEKIDLRVYGVQRQIEYDWEVLPGGDPSAIQMRYQDVVSTEITPQGDLLVKTAFGELSHKRPIAYQEVEGERMPVAAEFKPTGPGTYGFTLGAYDPELPLVIDPLVYSTFLGGSLNDQGGYSLTVDSAGCAYVTGPTHSNDFPTTAGAYDNSHNSGLVDAFVSKFNAAGNALVYSSYLGGGEVDIGRRIVVDSAGCAYVTGYTYSSDFPTTAGAFDTSHNGIDAFVSKFNATGSALLYSSFLGGSHGECGHAIAVDGAGCAYVTGYTDSSDFPTTAGAFDTSHNGGSYGQDAFVSKFNAAGSDLVYSTYLGGNTSVGIGIAVDSAGYAYVAGYTGSSDFPTTVGAYDISPNGGYDVFVSKFNDTGSALVYSSYLGGSETDYCYAIAVDGAGCAYVTGAIYSSDFPITVQAYNTFYNSNGDAFVSKFNAAGNALVYSSYLGGGAEDRGLGIDVDNSGCAYVTGRTDSSDFPTTAGTFDTSLDGDHDAFVSKFNAAGEALAYSSFLGGSVDDYGAAIAVDSAGFVYVSGFTNSSNFPTTAGAYDTSFNGGDYDTFVSKLIFTPSFTVSGSVSLSGSPLAGVVLSGLPGSPTTDASGAYTAEVDPGWSGTVAPTLAGYFFSPASTTYINLTANQTTHYTASLIQSLVVTTPNGGENWTVGESHPVTWTSTGTIANVNIDYSTDSGGSWTPMAVGTTNDGSYDWTVPSVPSTTCLVRISDAVNAATLDTSNAVFTIVLPAETVSAPSQPAGANSGFKATSYPFTTGGSTSNLGHAIQYKFDWNDGSDSGWLAEGTTGAAHSWTANGAYDVRAMARCVSDTAIESLWSTTHAITISDSGTFEEYISPAQHMLLPEVIWASATGGGTWMSDVQITDIRGGSQVSVYYCTAAGRRGPFLLWNNGSGGPLRSVKFSNILETIDGLDSGVFTYYNTVGAVEVFTQDAAHVLQVTTRTSNGSYSKTFPAFSLHDANTTDTSRAMIIPNLTNNSVYRSTVGMYNPTADAVTVEFKSFDANNTQIGTTITKTLNGYGFSAFSPFTDAGLPYPAYSYDNIIVRVQPVSGSGKVFCFGASANNVTNDPASHIAVQNSAGHDNGPSSKQILPEAIWAAATGGGTWMSEAQIVDVSGGSVVSVYFDYGSGNRRGPFVLWTGGSAGSKIKYANILQQIGTIDSGVTFYGKVGAVEFQTQESSHFIQVTARTLNGNYSKTFPGLNLVDSGTADTNRIMLIQNYASNSTYRSTCGFFNPTANALTVEFTLLNSSGAQIGTPFSKTFVGYDFQAFLPFTEAGVPYPVNSFDNVILRVRPTSGSGQVVCFGASANNASNDPAAHIAVQGQ